MKLLFKQRFLSWFDSYNIYALPAGQSAENFGYQDEYIAYVVEGQLAWGHKFHIADRNGNLVGRLEQRIFTFLPKFDIYVGNQMIGTVEKEFTLFRPSFYLDFRGWRVDGNFFEWDYSITDGTGNTVARIEKQLFRFTDTYLIDIADDRDALIALMVVLAIDAEKCSRN
jgi:uncharacterized protein YxjI